MELFSGQAKRYWTNVYNQIGLPDPHDWKGTQEEVREIAKRIKTIPSSNLREETEEEAKKHTNSPCDGLGIKKGVDARKYEYIPIQVLDESGGGVRYTTTHVVASVLARITRIWGGTPTNDDAREWVQKVVGVTKDDAGHVIGSQLGGSGQLIDGNIFPQNLSVNRGRMAVREGWVKAQILRGRDICALVILDYTRSTFPYPGRPFHVIYHVWVDDKFFPSPAPPKDLVNPF